MARRNNRQRGPAIDTLEPDPLISSAMDSGFAAGGGASQLVWSKPVRGLASVGILVYLAILLIGPLSNPIASTHLTRPIAERIAPIHRALFLGHGYRFFAPDPGPTHRLLYRGVRADGTEFSGHFPDRENHWPRLLYHRWFMLSETMFNEQALKPSLSQFKQRNAEYDRQILRLRTEGKRKLLEQLLRERELETTFFETTTARVELLAGGIAKVLLQRNDGTSIELFVQERRIPFPEEVADGLRLDSESLLSDPIKIGELDAEGFRIPVPIENLPAQEEPK
jgi:hypothetical protein